MPGGKLEPEAGVQEAGKLPSHASVAVALLNDTGVPPGPVQGVVMFPGQLSAGGVLSVTLTVKLQVPMLPLPSVAEQVTVVLPSGKAKPEAGAQVGV